jgi:hypothetical protein
MGDVIDFRWAKGRIEAKRQGIMEKKLGIIHFDGAPEYVNRHPVPNRHWGEGRVYLLSCLEKRTKEMIDIMKRNGHEDVVVEKRAYHFSQDGKDIRPMSKGLVSLYGRRKEISAFRQEV